jgi:hypothetical protein
MSRSYTAESPCPSQPRHLAARALGLAKAVRGMCENGPGVRQSKAAAANPDGENRSRGHEGFTQHFLAFHQSFARDFGAPLALDFA